MSVTAGPSGDFEIAVDLNQDASVMSGLPALKIDSFNDQESETLHGTGRDIVNFVATYGPSLEVAMSPRVTAETICRTYGTETGQDLLRFPYTNRHSIALTVESDLLNTLSSVTGNVSPIDTFYRTDSTNPAGYFGFELPIEHFIWFDQNGTERVIALWRLLGREIGVDSPKTDIQFCELGGELAGCQIVSETMDNKIFETAMAAARTLNTQAVKAKTSGRWKPTGKFRSPHFSHAARANKAIRAILQSLPTNRYLCPERAPSGCSTITYPKDALIQQFQRMLRAKLPEGLQHLRKLYPKLRSRFVAEVEKQPSSFLACGP